MILLQTNLMSLHHEPEILHDFEARSRVESTSRFVEKQDLGRSDQLTSDAQPPLLATTDPLADWSPNNDIGLLLKPECIQQLFHSSRAFLPRNRPAWLV